MGVNICFVEAGAMIVGIKDLTVINSSEQPRYEEVGKPAFFSTTGCKRQTGPFKPTTVLCNSLVNDTVSGTTYNINDYYSR